MTDEDVRLDVAARLDLTAGIHLALQLVGGASVDPPVARATDPTIEEYRLGFEHLRRQLSFAVLSLVVTSSTAQLERVLRILAPTDEQITVAMFPEPKEEAK